MCVFLFTANKPSQDNKVAGWSDRQKNDLKQQTGEFFCAVCEKNFSKQTVFDVHNGSKQHKKKVKAKATGAVIQSNNGGFDKEATTLEIARAEFTVEQWTTMLKERVRCDLFWRVHLAC